MDNEPADFQTLSGVNAYAQGLRELASAARLQLTLVSVDLDRAVYAAEPLVETIKQFLLAQRRARLRVLIHQPRSAMRSGHRLVELGRILSSRMEFRQMPEERQRSHEEYLIADEQSLLLRGGPQELESRLFRVPAEARARLRMFEQAWNEAVPARELSELKL